MLLLGLSYRLRFLEVVVLDSRQLNTVSLFLRVAKNRLLLMICSKSL